MERTLGRRATKKGKRAVSVGKYIPLPLVRDKRQVKKSQNHESVEEKEEKYPLSETAKVVSEHI